MAGIEVETASEDGPIRGIRPLPGRNRAGAVRRVTRVVLALAVAAGAFVGGRLSTDPSSLPTVLASLPVTECPTTYGAYSSGPTNYPAEVAAEVPTQMVSELAFYSDATRSLEPVLGPAGWACTVGVGADGTTGVDLVPPAPTAGTTTPVQPSSSSSESVIALSAASCTGCIYSEVCAYVPTAAQDLGFFEVTCPTARPPEEHVSWLMGFLASGPPVKDIIAFGDPPGVKGSGDGSGAAYPSRGVILYSYLGPTKVALSKESCTLPAADEALCTAIVGNFLDRNWMLAS